MDLFKRCFGIQKPATPGSLSPDDLQKMLDLKKRQNAELKNLVRRLEEDLEFEQTCSKVATPTSTFGRSGWVKILRSDQPKIWRSAWAVLEDGHLKFYRGEGSRSVKIADVDLSAHDWKLSFRNGPYFSDADAVPDCDLPGIIVLNVLEEDAPNGFYRLYMNTGSAESKTDWMAALELEICCP